MDNKGQTMLMAPLRYYTNIKRVPVDDWESFLYSICELTGVIHLDWFDERLIDALSVDEEGTSKLIADMKGNRDKIVVSVNLIINYFI